MRWSVKTRGINVSTLRFISEYCNIAQDYQIIVEPFCCSARAAGTVKGFQYSSESTKRCPISISLKVSITWSIMVNFLEAFVQQILWVRYSWMEYMQNVAECNKLVYCDRDWYIIIEDDRRWQKMTEDDRRWQKMAESEISWKNRRWQKVTEGDRRWQKVTEGDRRWQKVTE